MSHAYKRDLAKSKRSESASIDQFVAALRRILVEMKTDKKGAPGKYVNYINFIVVGNNPVKRDVMSYLLDAGAVVVENNVYVVKRDTFKGMRLSMHALASLDIKSVLPAYKQYLTWRGDEETLARLNNALYNRKE